MSDKKAILIADDAAAYEILCSGARALDVQPIALFAGSEEDASSIAAYGAEVRYFGQLPDGAMFEDCASAFESVIASESPAIVLAAMDKRTQCLVGRLAVRLNMPVVTDAAEVSLTDNGVEVKHLVYGGAAERIERSNGPAIVLVGSSTFEVSAASAAGSVVAQDATIEAGPIKIVGREEKQEEAVDLGSAKVVVCVGRGIQSEENVATAREIAKKFGGDIACTRPVAEGEGWLARNRYLGVSGETIKPDLYIGLGVSGQVQHTVGMRDSQVVFAVNKDANAPIFKQCDLGLVADVEKVLPALSAM